MENARDVALKDEDVRRFWRQGVLSLGRITTEQELTWLRSACDEVVKRKIGCTPQELGQKRVRPEHEALVTILSPESIMPELNETIFYRNAKTILARLFGVKETCLLTGGRIFFKRAHSHETPWHQDAAYRPPPYHSASVWMPLEPVTLENGCLHYIERSHRAGLYAHHLHDDHLVADDVDPSLATAYPLPDGEGITHHCCTLHYAGPNKTDHPRRALVIVCQLINHRERAEQTS